MKRLGPWLLTAFILALFCSPLAACGTTSGTTHAGVIVRQADYGLEAVYNTAATQFIDAAPRLSADDKAKGQALLSQAYGVLLLARQAQAVGDATTVNAQSTALSNLLSQIRSLINP